MSPAVLRFLAERYEQIEVRYDPARSTAKPLPVPVVLPVQKDFDLTPAPAMKILGPLVIAATIILYVIFR